MPLLKSASKEAFKKNLQVELASGKPRDQSLAISYSMKRKAGGKDNLAAELGKKK